MWHRDSRQQSPSHQSAQGLGQGRNRETTQRKRHTLGGPCPHLQERPLPSTLGAGYSRVHMWAGPVPPGAPTPVHLPAAPSPSAPPAAPSASTPPAAHAPSTQPLRPHSSRRHTLRPHRLSVHTADGTLSVQTPSPSKHPLRPHSRRHRLRPHTLSVDTAGAQPTRLSVGRRLGPGVRLFLDVQHPVDGLLGLGQGLLGEAGQLRGVEPAHRPSGRRGVGAERGGGSGRLRLPGRVGSLALCAPGQSAGGHGPAAPPGPTLPPAGDAAGAHAPAPSTSTAPVRVLLCGSAACRDVTSGAALPGDRAAPEAPPRHIRLGPLLPEVGQLVRGPRQGGPHDSLLLWLFLAHQPPVTRDPRRALACPPREAWAALGTGRQALTSGPAAAAPRGRSRSPVSRPVDGRWEFRRTEPSGGRGRRSASSRPALALLDPVSTAECKGGGAGDEAWW